MVETERLILEPFTLSDVDEYLNIICDEDICKYVRYGSSKTYDGAYELVEAYSNGDFINDFYIKIKNKFTGEIIGSIIAYRCSASSLDVSYLIGKNFRRQRFMKEALTGFMHSLQSSYTFLFFTVNKENLVSTNVVKSIGAEVYRELRDSVVYRVRIQNLF